MTARVDAELCVGHGRCYVVAPEVFAPDEHGHCVIASPEVDPAQVAAARAGAAACPEDAIELDD